MKLNNALVVLDLETTGIWIEKDKIIEIAMIKRHPDGTEETYEKKVNPGMKIPAIVTQLTGIDNGHVLNAPAFSAIAQEVLDFIGDSDIAGFNAERFDFPLLERECRDAGLKFNWRDLTVYDAQKVYHLNEKRDLSAAYKFYCQEDLENAHSALADTRATLNILEAQVDQYCPDNPEITSLKQFNYKNNSEFFDEDRRFRWWDGKLYMMFGKYARQLSLQDLVRKDKGYLQWILGANFSQEIKTLVQNAIDGKFPVYEEPKVDANV